MSVPDGGRPATVHGPTGPGAGERGASGTVEETDVLVVGAGFGGIGMGIRLARRGLDSFVILERAQDVGGTWRDNTYPGVACDIPSHLYSFSFRQNPDWSRVFAPGEEIQEYLRRCVREEGLTAHLRLGTDVQQVDWHDDEGRWHVRTDRGSFVARVLVLAVGRLSEPLLPRVDSLETFPGPVFHSAAWDHTADLTGARVGVVGTGASAVQVVPELARVARELVVFQRSAPYVLPRQDRAYTAAERRLFALDPDALQQSRSAMFWDAEQAFVQRLGVPAAIDALRARALGHLAERVPDPALRAALTPDYEIGCKRVLFSNDYYPALQAPHVTLEPTALARVDGTRATSVAGHGFDLDALVLATGFQSTRPPFARRVVGRHGGTLAEHWGDGMTSYASTVVHGFPNMFVIDGPNASLGHSSAIYMIETQIDYVLGALAFQGAHGQVVLEVTADAERAYTAMIDEMSRDTVWIDGGCRSWYVDEHSGRLTLLWPDFAHRFRERNATFDPAPYRLAAATASG